MAIRTVKRRLAWLTAAIVAAALAALCLQLYARQWTPSRKDYAIQGVDISAIQGVIAWPTLKTRGVDFAYMQATSGDSGRDPLFLQNWQDSEAAGLGHGAIHIFDLCRPAHEQATNFIATVPREENALPPAITLGFRDGCTTRPGREAVVKDVKALIEAIESHAGKRAILHISQDFEAAYRIAPAIHRTLWLDRDFLVPDYAGRPWVMWRASAMKRVEGIDGPVNWNVIRE